MRLGKLVLKNIKGIKNLTVDVGGNNASIYGDNALGKTTVIDAMFWLLHDTSSNGSKFNPKTLDGDGNEIHRLDHSAEGFFLLDDNQDITLKKIFKEQWVKTRGSIKKSFKGHVTEYSIDGVEVKKKDYVAKAELIATQDVFKLLSDVDYFSGKMPWKKRRELVLEVCGDVSDEDVIASNKELSELPALLGRHSVEDFTSVTKSSMAKINKKIDRLPARVDEATKAKVEVEGTEKEASQLVDATSTLLVKAQNKLDSIVDCDVTKEQGELNEFNSALISLNSTIDKDIIEAKELCDTKIGEHQAVLDEINPQIAKIKAKLENLKSKNNRLNETKQSLYSEFATVNEREFDESALICPTCEKPATPEETIKIKAQFNKHKSQELDDVNNRGQQVNKDTKELTSEVDNFERNIADLETKVQPSIDAIASLREKKKNVKPSEKNTNELADLQKLADDKQIEIDKIIAKVDQSLVEKAQNKVEDLGVELKTAQTATQGFITNEAQDTRIAELVKEEEELAESYEKLEGHLFLTEQFLVTKVKAMEGNISAKFNRARFKMFETQINGGLKECCDVIVDGVPYGAGLNNAGEINIGIDIINTLSDHFGVNVPIIVDNAESVVDVDVSESQIIKLIVSGEDKTLRVEQDV